MREIVLDTETTGLDPYQGDRLVEIGCVELYNRFPTGNTFHRYINPERTVPAEAFAVHGLSAEFLRDKPTFAEVADDLLGFLDNAALVIHNASFDHGFLNAELDRVAKPLIARERLIDTLLLARRKYPGGPNRPLASPLRPCALRPRRIVARRPVARFRRSRDIRGCVRCAGKFPRRKQIRS